MEELEEELARAATNISSVLSFEECESYGINVTNTTFGTIGGTNVTCLGHAPTLTRAALVKACVLGALAVLSFIGNAATIWSIKRSRRSRRASRSSCSAIYSLIMQLSIADLLVTVFCLAGDAWWSYTVAWTAGNAACKLFKFLQMFSLHLSTFVLVLVGVDRFVAVKYPMKSLSTARRGTWLVALAWALSAFLSIPQLVIFREAKGPFIEDFRQCVTYGAYTERWQEQLYACISIFFMFVLPLLILMATYAATFITISRSEKVFREEVAGGRRPDLNRRRLIHRAKMKSLRISVVIVVAFIVWWTPYYTMMIIFIFLDPDKIISEELQTGIFFFGSSNSLVNPVIYGAFQLWPGRRERSMGSQREGSMMNHRSTMTHASMIVRNNSSRRAAAVERAASTLRHKLRANGLNDEAHGNGLNDDDSAGLVAARRRSCQVVAFKGCDGGGGGRPLLQQHHHQNNLHNNSIYLRPNINNNNRIAETGAEAAAAAAAAATVNSSGGAAGANGSVTGV